MLKADGGSLRSDKIGAHLLRLKCTWSQMLIPKWWWRHFPQGRILSYLLHNHQRILSPEKLFFALFSFLFRNITQMIILCGTHMVSCHYMVLMESQTPLPIPVIALRDVLSALFDKVTEDETGKGEHNGILRPRSCAFNYCCPEGPGNKPSLEQFLPFATLYLFLPHCFLPSKPQVKRPSSPEQEILWPTGVSLPSLKIETSWHNCFYTRNKNTTQSMYVRLRYEKWGKSFLLRTIEIYFVFIFLCR